MYPTTITRYAYAQSGQDLYVLGGVSDGVRVATANRYNATTNIWASIAPVPVASEAPAAALLDGAIYLAEGDTGDSFNIYNIATNTWSAGPPRPGYADNYGAAAGAFGGKVYVVGGGTSGATDTTSIYTVATNSWTTGAPAPVPFFLAGYTTVGQYLYVAGGFNSASPTANVGVTMRLDMATGAWSLGPTFTPGRADEALAASGNTLYALGGDATGGGFFDSTAACRLARRQRLAERLVDLGRRSAAERAPGQRGRLLLDRPGRRRGVVDRRDQRWDVPVPERAHLQGGAAASSASTASATTATSATASASAASGPMSCPESPRAASRRREDEDPASALLGRQGATRPRSPLAARPRREPVTEARHDQAPELPGQAGDRSALEPTTTQRAPAQRAPFLWPETLN